jgi:hypothetical protein
MRDNGFAAAQRAYEAQQPPGWDEPDYAEDCEDGTCGECKPCVTQAKEDWLETQAEAKWERLQEDRDDR